MNETGNGEDKNIVKFPTLAERDRARREKIKQEKEWQRQYKKERHKAEPFLKIGNIPPFTKIFTLLILLVNVPLFFMPSIKLQTLYHFGFIPVHFSIETVYTIITHLVLHGDVMHLTFNTVMMLAMGMFFEKMYGTRAIEIFFLLCGIAGAVTFFAFQPQSSMPVIGASGAISGLFAAVIMAMHDSGRVFKLGRFTSRGPWPILLLWIVIMVAIGILGGDNIAWQAHIGGFFVGIVLFYSMQRNWITFKLNKNFSDKPANSPTFIDSKIFQVFILISCVTFMGYQDYTVDGHFNNFATYIGGPVGVGLGNWFLKQKDGWKFWEAFFPWSALTAFVMALITTTV